MRELPKGWKRVPLGTVAKINPKLPFDHLDDSTEVSFLPMRAVEEVSNKVHLTETREYAQVKKGFTAMTGGDVIFAKITPCMENGKIAVVPALKNQIGFGSTEFHVFRCDIALSNKYLFHFLVQARTRQDAQHQMTGAVGQKRVPKKYLEDLPIPLPPLPEQLSIVARLDELFSELDAGVASLQKARDQLKVYRQAVLKRAFEGRLVGEQGRKTHTEDTEGAEGRAELPEGWRWESVENLASKSNYALGIGPFGSNLKVSDYRETGVPLVFVRNITRKNFRSNLKYVSLEKAQELTAHVALPGDILITKMGDPPGDCALYPRSETPAVITADCIKFRVDENVADVGYVLLALQGKSTREQFEKITKGVAQKKVSLQRFRKIALPLPPLAEQHAIVAEVERRFSVADALEATIDQSLKKAEALRQSILQKAFRGELVPQEGDLA